MRRPPYAWEDCGCVCGVCTRLCTALTLFPRTLLGWGKSCCLFTAFVTIGLNQETPISFQQLGSLVMTAPPSD